MRTHVALGLCVLLLLSPQGWAQGGGKVPSGPGQALPPDILALEPLSVVLGRPTDSSITLNLLGDRDQEIRVGYGPAAVQKGVAPGPETSLKSEILSLKAGTPAELLLDGLQPGTTYRYSLEARARGQGAFTPGPTGSFTTRRPPGSTFSFEIMGDSHPERSQQFDPRLYIQNLTKAAADAPDFFLTIGDDFSVDTLARPSKAAVDEIYRRQRLFLSLVGRSAPLFLVNGNHEQAALANLNGGSDNVALWAQNARNAYFPQPGPDSFYSGDAAKVEGIGLLRDYYAWTWGDALFVVIDPYWHSPEPVDNVLGGGDKTRDLWRVTLGKEQYDWLAATLRNSKAAFKFVFAHHVSGTGRGGIEAATGYEWGGRSADGRLDFAARRPGWEAPIQALMAKSKVTAFIQGHDHLFASQVLDGVAYITLPEPADPYYALYNREAYRSGDCLPNSGRVRFTVGPAKVSVEYLQEWLPGEGPAQPPSGAAYRLEIPLGGQPQAGVTDPAQVAAGTPPAPPGAAKGGGGVAKVGEKGRKGPETAPPAGRAAGGQAPGGPPRPQAATEEIQVGPSGDLHARTLVEVPGATSVSLATAFLRDVDYYYLYGEDPARLDRRTPTRSAAAGTVARDKLAGLEPGRTYHYRLSWASRDSGATAGGGVDFVLADPGQFATRRAPGAGFTFDIEADPHFDANSGPGVYTRTLALMATDSPDFVMDLGDSSMVEKLASDAPGYLGRNRLVRSWWDDIGGATPFFMVVGNHDGEHGWTSPKGKPTSAEAAALRRTWLIDPRQAPKDGYSVFSDTVYAFEWGDALLVALDPYAAEASKPTDDGWTWTLGKAQYDWLSKVLEESTAAYRMVFIHNLAGGKGSEGRGGADWADRYEWGGLGPDGKDSFSAHRPGWAMPIHDLLRKRGVGVVFHGHDHLYAREERDGIIYQTLPQPSLGRDQALDAGALADYGYTQGVFLPSPGYLRVTVSPARARVEYLRSADGVVAQSYDLAPAPRNETR